MEKQSFVCFHISHPTCFPALSLSHLKRRAFHIRIGKVGWVSIHRHTGAFGGRNKKKVNLRMQLAKANKLKRNRRKRIRSGTRDFKNKKFYMKLLTKKISLKSVGR